MIYLLRYSRSVKTTAGRFWLTVTASLVISLAACGSRPQPAAQHEGAEPIARTEFTERIENFFEYEPLKAGKPSQFRIHLTDLSDGSPVEKADVTLIIRSKSGGDAGQTKAKIGKVTGIYVAETTIAKAGEYTIEFHIKNNKLDGRIPLSEFRVE
jgi:hypothetical protein